MLSEEETVCCTFSGVEEDVVSPSVIDKEITSSASVSASKMGVRHFRVWNCPMQTPCNVKKQKIKKNLMQ